MDSSSLIYTSPSFTINSTHDDIADIADRVVQQLRIENGFENDYDFSFSDDDNNPTQTGKQIQPDERGTQIQQDEQDEFEFPVISRNSNSNSNSNSSSVSVSHLADEHQISLQYPLFDQSLLSQTDLIAKSSDVVDNSPVTEPEPELKPVTSPRKSLKKLFSEDYDAPSTSSSSETDDLDGVTPGTYCEWKPKTERELPRGKHKKSNSVSINNESKRWKVRDLLKRSYSDDNYSTGKDSPVVVFLPPLSPKQKTNGEKVNKSEKTGKTERNIPAATKMERNNPAATKTERNIPAYRTKIGNIRVPPYLPYRQGQVAAFGNFTTGSSTNMNMYRY
ncbi:hypothetical protein HanRHA438_Chr02g0053041 [Helianthus annuus]|uniref:Uncharacterized protein n=1 Tax=Helianthus annuus TaxID=4232 RepID=A0A9K3NYK3_HELAN|nr:hypothetical protein HanXRQr2_Chr02g0051701 [Helianthus annuus]KAJ0938728.1 hypothetical protein HanRHA438_Chr02g0053041 [Helianthus annuus]KAJ0950678.1 hypothetical protein HanPSC8_Chr02g0051081 [Helianthus annuus]